MLNSFASNIKLLQLKLIILIKQTFKVLKAFIDTLFKIRLSTVWRSHVIAKENKTMNVN